MQVRREHFQHKQRVLQEVTAKAYAEVAQRRRAALSMCLSAWRHVSGVYKILAQRLAALQRLSGWRHAALAQIHPSQSMSTSRLLHVFSMVGPRAVLLMNCSQAMLQSYRRVHEIVL